MITFDLAAPATLLYIDAEHGNRELHDRIYAALVTNDLYVGNHSIAWNRPGMGGGWDLAAVAAWYAVDHDLHDTLNRFRGWTFAGELHLNGTVTGGVATDGTTAWIVHDVNDLALILRTRATELREAA